MRSPYLKCLVFLLLLVSGGRGILSAQQDTINLEDLRQSWSDLEARDDLAVVERLSLQAELVKEAGPLVGWGDPVVWEWVRELLDGWETSAEIEVARAAYIGLLSEMGEGLSATGAAAVNEAGLRDYFQKALNVVQSPTQEGRMLVHLAESVLRESETTRESGRRVESWLQQAAGLLGDEVPMDAVQLHLAELYQEFGSDSSRKDPEEDSWLSRAVFHYRQVLELRSAREANRQRARESLDLLLQPGLEVRVTNRYLPENDIRVTVATRNLEEIEVEVYSLPWMEAPESMNWREMRDTWLGGERVAEQLRFKESQTLSSRNRFDWQENEFRLGENFPSGWFRLRVTGGGLEAEDLLLVTPLEVVLVSHESHEHLVWVADAETGLAVPGAVVSVMDQEGRILAQLTTDEAGTVQLDPESGSQWTELHVLGGISPALLLRGTVEDKQGPLPWVIPASLGIRPGETMEWVMVAQPALPDLSQGTFKVKTPDGLELAADLEPLNETVFRGRVVLPASLALPGPLYLQFPSGESLLLAHLEIERNLPLNVEFSGERYLMGKHLFFDSAPVGLRIRQNPAAAGEMPEYVRIRLYESERRPAYSSGQWISSHAGALVFENIQSVSGSEPGDILVELPALETEGKIRPMRLEVRTLDGDNLLGEGLFALMPYRTILQFSQSERIIESGQSLQVNLSFSEDSPRLPRPPEGELVIYRQTWESRYIHRKRGTPLSEEEYLSLPDRSLLGAAKTDYRLLEQGFIREEIRRIQLTAGSEQEIPLQFDRSGYYLIEFAERDVEVRTEYPEGPLEVWVMPDSSDLRAFRSDKPRLIYESDSAGHEEILLLLDRKEVSALLDLEYEDGTTDRRLLKPDSNAILIAHEPSSPSPLVMCRVTVVGARKTDFLCRHLTHQDSAGWELEADKLMGLNPGAAFSWKLQHKGASLTSPALVNFYPESASRVISNWIDWQRGSRDQRLHALEPEVVTLGNWLPLYHPLSDPGSSGAGAAEPGKPVELEPSALPVLYPEFAGKLDSRAGSVSFQFAEPVPAENFLLAEGTLPQSAGRWIFSVFGTIEGNGLSGFSWPLSTELPIRISMDAPDLLRVGDRISVPLKIENTTPFQETLQLIASASGTMELMGRERDAIILAASQKATQPLEARAAGQGEGTVSVKLQAVESLSEAQLDFNVVEPAPDKHLRFHVVPPGNPQWKESVSLEEWEHGALLVSASLGGILPEFWSVLRGQQLPAEPLMAALGDWALERVQVHHGMPFGAASVDGSLALQLEALQTPVGGWAWTQGHSADPWLSALVLWSIETFSAGTGDAFDGMRKAARVYLESILVDEDISTGSRLFALRALAAPDSFGEPVRPSRIQAKTFLDFLHNRGSLDGGELSMLLQVSRAYGFAEEERLLANELIERLNSKGNILLEGFWGNSLMYLGLDPSRETAVARQLLLQGALSELNTTGVRRSWKQLGGFLNFLAVYLWEGDFMVEGEARISMNGEAPQSLELRPGEQGKGSLLLSLPSDPPESGAVALEVDASAATTPLILMLTGTSSQRSQPPDFPEQEISLFREFLEVTLLSGINRQTVPLQDPVSLNRNDTLQLRISLYVDQAKDFAELRFAVPAGAVLATDGIQYSFEPATGDAILDPPVLSHHEQADRLTRVMRMESLAGGRHEFILSYRAAWPGSFAFPPHVLVIPKTGESYRIGEPGELIIKAIEK